MNRALHMDAVELPHAVRELKFPGATFICDEADVELPHAVRELKSPGKFIVNSGGAVELPHAVRELKLITW